MNIEKILLSTSLSKSEHQVLAYLLDNLNSSGQLKVRQVAKENYTSTSTVMRLSKKLGYTGFAEMLYHLRAQCCSALPSAEMGVPVEVGATAAKLALFLQSYDILIYGQGFSELIAEYIYKKLLALGIRCWFIQTLEFETVSKNFKGKIDAVLIVSKSGKTPHMLRTAQKAKENNTVVAVITGDAMSPLSKTADIPLVIHDDHPLDDENALANRFFGHVILLFEDAVKVIQSKEQQR